MRLRMEGLVYLNVNQGSPPDDPLISHPQASTKRHVDGACSSWLTPPLNGTPGYIEASRDAQGEDLSTGDRGEGVGMGGGRSGENNGDGVVSMVRSHTLTGFASGRWRKSGWVGKFGTKITA